MPIPTISKKGPKGPAEITVTPKIVKVSFDSGDDYNILVEDAPKDVQAGRFNVRLNNEGNQIWGITPLGPVTIIGKLVDILPAPKSKDGDTTPGFYLVPGAMKPWGMEPDRLFFNVKYELYSADRHDGLTVVTRVPYTFERYGDTDIAGIGGRGTRATEDFLRVNGLNLDEDTIPWSDNVLIWLKETVLPNKPPFVSIAFKESGYIDDVSALPEGVEPKRRS
jgi:hypothetical protein